MKLLKKSVVISDKAGADVYKSAVRLVYEGRELSCRDRWAVFTGMLNLFAD